MVESRSGPDDLFVRAAFVSGRLNWIARSGCASAALATLETGAGMIGGIEVIRGELTQQRCEAIVRGVPVGTRPDPNRDPVLAAGGPELLAAVQSVGLPGVGRAVVTAGFRLHAPYVIHTVAPRWTEGSAQEQRLLGRCHYAIVAEAVRYRIRTVAMAPLGPGFPSTIAASIGIGTLYHALADTLAVYRVSIVCPTWELFRIYDAALNELDD